MFSIGEAMAKRIREKYFRAILRQDIAFFDNVGAGEVATRIQTDTRKFKIVLSNLKVYFHAPRFLLDLIQLGTSEKVPSKSPVDPVSVRPSCRVSCNQLYLRIFLWFYQYDMSSCF
jgi:ABC-type multidrug transport system fused ATPase/permease subunit